MWLVCWGKETPDSLNVCLGGWLRSFHKENKKLVLGWLICYFPDSLEVQKQCYFLKQNLYRPTDTNLADMLLDHGLVDFADQGGKKRGADSGGKTSWTCSKWDLSSFTWMGQWSLQAGVKKKDLVEALWSSLAAFSFFLRCMVNFDVPCLAPLSLLHFCFSRAVDLLGEVIALWPGPDISMSGKPFILPQ